MEQQTAKTDRWTLTLRWIARLLAVLAAGLFVFFAIESGGRLLMELSWSRPQGWPLLLVLLAAVTGVLVAWRWELVGGALAVAGAMAIIGLVVWGSGLDMIIGAVLFALPIAMAGILYLVCCARTRSATVTG
jgi:hypothetical protein